MKLIRLTLAIAACTLPALPSAHSQSTTPQVYPFVSCTEAAFKHGQSGGVDIHLGYVNNTGSEWSAQPGSAQNFFQPGTPDLGQSAYFDQGRYSDFFVANYFPDYTDLSYVLAGQLVPIHPFPQTPLCVVPTFTPAPALNFLAPGTYTNQYLGEVYGHSAEGTGEMGVTGIMSGSNPNISVANLNLVQSPNADPYGRPSRYVYGDIQIDPGPIGSSAVLMNFMYRGAVAGTGMTSVSLAAPPFTAAGCSTDVTSSVSGKVALPVQLLGSQIWTQTVTFTNTSGKAIPGPITLALNSLSPNAKLFTAGGTGNCPGITGAPYIFVTDSLAPNGNAAVVLTFTNTQVPTTAITYTPVILSGGTKL